MSIFEKASRLKLRFESGTKGIISSEDLWDLPLESKSTPPRANLEDIALALHAKIQAQPKISFVNKSKKSTSTSRNELALEVVTHVIDTLVAERDEAALRAKNNREAAKIAEILEEKDDEALRNKSPQELRDMAAKLKS